MRVQPVARGALFLIGLCFSGIEISPQGLRRGGISEFRDFASPSLIASGFTLYISRRVSVYIARIKTREIERERMAKSLRPFYALIHTHSTHTLGERIGAKNAKP